MSVVDNLVEGSFVSTKFAEAGIVNVDQVMVRASQQFLASKRMVGEIYEFRWRRSELYFATAGLRDLGAST